MKIKVAEATKGALNWMVAKAEGRTVISTLGGGVWVRGRYEDGREIYGFHMAFNPSIDWEHGGPISEEAGISSTKKHDGWWLACIYSLNDDPTHYAISHSRLEAEMRCYVISKLGEEVEVPDDLVDSHTKM